MKACSTRTGPATAPPRKGAIHTDDRRIDWTERTCRRRPRLSRTRSPHPPPRPGRDPVPQGAHVRDSRERRRVQHGSQPGRLLRPANRRCDSHGRVPDRRAHRRPRPGDGRHAVLQDVQARRRARAEHGDRLQRSRLRRARADRLLQPLQRGRGAAQARRLRLGGDLRRRGPLVPQRRHLRLALRDHLRADHRRHGSGAPARRDRVARPELPREALGCRRRRAPCRGHARADRRARRRARRQRRGPAEGPRHRRAGSHHQGARRSTTARSPG